VEGVKEKSNLRVLSIMRNDFGRLTDFFSSAEETTGLSHGEFTVHELDICYA
jgi:hypothetical protein